MASCNNWKPNLWENHFILNLIDLFVLSNLCALDQIKEILAAKIYQLEALERRMEQLELISHDLQQKKCPSTSYQSHSENVQIARQSTETISTMPRTCRDIREAHPSQSSGMYWIDPDGQGVGDDPIVVSCNMTRSWLLLQIN